MPKMTWNQLVVTLVVSMTTVVVLTYVYVLRSTDSSDSFKEGYEQGAWHTLLYYSTVEEWPSQYWRYNHYKDDLQTEEDLLETIND